MLPLIGQMVEVKHRWLLLSYVEMPKRQKVGGVMFWGRIIEDELVGLWHSPDSVKMTT